MSGHSKWATTKRHKAAIDAKKGKKTVKIPEVKIADGVLATSELLKRTLTSANPAVAPDAFEHVIAQKQEASINFLIQQAKIRNSELKKTSVQEFVETLRDIKADQKRKELNNVEISAYASPDGGVELNDKLAAKRESTTRDYVDNVLKKQEIDTHVDAKYTAQDWEGFQQLVSASSTFPLHNAIIPRFTLLSGLLLFTLFAFVR